MGNCPQTSPMLSFQEARACQNFRGESGLTGRLETSLLVTVAMGDPLPSSDSPFIVTRNKPTQTRIKQGDTHRTVWKMLVGHGVALKRKSKVHRRKGPPWC